MGFINIQKHNYIANIEHFWYNSFDVSKGVKTLITRNQQLKVLKVVSDAKRSF